VNHKRLYSRPVVKQISLVPEEAVLVVCKNHEVAGDYAAGLSNCSWPKLTNGGQPCKGVTGS